MEVRGARKRRENAERGYDYDKTEGGRYSNWTALDAEEDIIVSAGAVFAHRRKLTATYWDSPKR